MTIDQIIKVDIAISEAMAIDGGYDTILIIGPLPKTPGGHMTPDVAGYTGTQDLKSAGFSTDDPVYISASKVFSQSPKPSMVMVAVQKTTSGSTEKVDVTLDRAKAVPGGSLEEYGEFDNERVTDLKWVMYTLIRERVASMYELTYVYNLDEMLKLYDLIMMQRDIEYSRSQKERGGDS